jgi:hypothetical protein
MNAPARWETGIGRSSPGLALGAVLLAIVGLACGGGRDAPLSTTSSEATALVGETASPAADGSRAVAATDPPSDSPAATPVASENAVTTPRPTATPIAAPRIVSFSVPAEIDCSGPQLPGTIHIAWSILRATGVTLSIGGSTVYKSYQGTAGEDDVPFDCTGDNAYLLATTGGTGPAATATKHARAFAPRIVLFSVSPAVCDPAEPHGSVQVSFTVAYATGVTLYRGDTQLDLTTVYGTYPLKEYLEFEVAFDCSKHEQWYRLTTSGGYGTPASADRKATNQSST